MDIQPFLVAENVRSTGWFRPELVLTLGTLSLFLQAMSARKSASVPMVRTNSGRNQLALRRFSATR